MNRKTDDVPNLKGYSAKAYVKLLISSAVGIFVFFVNFPLPAYQFTVSGWEFGAVGANSTMAIAHLSGLIRAALWSGNFRAMPVIVWLLGIYCMADLFFLRFDDFWRTTIISKILSVGKIFSFVVLTISLADFYFGKSPAFLSVLFTDFEALYGASIAYFVMDRLIVSITIILPLTIAFLPLLTDYGLIDLVGVIARRFMRPIFRLPGRAAVITVGALLGTFTVAHVAANNLYRSGRMNRRESIVIATSLASVSIGIMLLIAHNAGIMHIWNTYIWTTFLILLIVTLICVRIYPLNKISNDYKENVKPIPENEYERHIMRYAAKEALDTATSAEHFGKRLASVMKDTISLMATCSTGPAFFAVVGIALFMFTPVFAWLGYIFLPLMRIFLSAEEAGTASAGAVLGFVEVTLPSLLVAAGDWSLRIRYMLAVVPVTSLIFLASWIPCIMATELPVKFSHLIIIWLMRMFMSIILAGLFAIILFPAGAV